MNSVCCPQPAEARLKNASDHSSYKSGFIVSKINAFSFLALTTFGAEYCLTHAITHHPPKSGLPCSAVSLRQLSYLFYLVIAANNACRISFRLLDIKAHMIIGYCCYLHDYRIVFITSANEVMQCRAFVSLFICLLATLRKTTERTS